MPAAVDLAAQPALHDLAERLPDLAGKSYRDGQAIYRSGAVLQRAATPASASASIQGSGANPYRVTLAFADTLKPGCTCPAYRRNPWCKHVAALCLALLAEPDSFTPVDAPSELSAPTPRVKRGARTADNSQLRSAGLETVDRLLESLAEGGLLSFGADKQAQLQSAAELVTGLKLARLGRLLHLLHRHAADGSLDAPTFTNLLGEAWLVRQAVGAQLDGRIALDDVLAEDLIGRVWRARDRETLRGLRLLQVAYTRESDLANRVETSYLLSLDDAACYLERKITPAHLRREPPKPSYPLVLDVLEAEAYPGPPPRRLKLLQFEPQPFDETAVNRLLARADTSAARLRERLVAHLQQPFELTEVPVLFRPAALLSDGSAVAALDAHGALVPLDWPAAWAGHARGGLPAALAVVPTGAPFALFGRLGTAGVSPRLRLFALLSPALAWNRGPLYPTTDVAWTPD